MTTNYPSPDSYGDSPMPNWYGAAQPPAGDYPPTPAGELPPAADQQPPGPAAPKRSRRRALIAGVAAIMAAALVGGIAIADRGSNTINGSGSAEALLPTNPGDMNRQGNGTPASVSLATAAQQKGIVTIVSVLKYQNAESAGTGMILTPNGEILTNNHVVNGATSITVTVASTGQSYKADVVGTDPTDDVAVLQLRNASGLATANIGDSSTVSVGDAIVGVGNAGGTGALRAANGTVTALDKSITATDENGQDSEKLSGLIEVNAAIVSGDSGGPLYDSSGEIVGMDTAASANQLANSTAYAIPIDSAVKIASEIESGVETSKIHIGLPAFLGVGIAAQAAASGGAVVEQAIAEPAISAGIGAGSVIKSVDGTRITSSTSLKTVMSHHNPGDHVSVTWVDANGTSHTQTLTLSSGPAD